MSIRVSVVVPTYRRPELLQRCVAALVAQDFDPRAYEIIVVDDAASEDTRRLVAAWGCADDGLPAIRPLPDGPALRAPRNGHAAGHGTGGNGHTPGTDAAGPYPAAAPYWDEGAAAGRLLLDAPEEVLLDERQAPGCAAPDAGPSRPSIRYLATAGPRRGPAAARNAGWRIARGAIVAFTDDDCVPAPGWLAAGEQAFRPGVIGISGQILMPLEGTPTDYELNATGLERSEFVTANCFYRREALEAAGGFDERFTDAWREDTDLYFTLLEMVARAGLPSWSPLIRTVYARVPEALVVHPIRPAPWGVSLRQQRKNAFNALLYKKHPGLYRQRIQPTPPYGYYVTVATLLASAGAFLAQQPLAGLGAAALWSGLTLRFAARRLQGTTHDPHHVFEMAVTSALIPPLAVAWRLAGAIKHRVWFL